MTAAFAYMSETATEPTHEEIELAAYFKWQMAGCPDGRSEEFYLEAERELRLKSVLTQYRPNISGTETENVPTRSTTREACKAY